MPVWLQGLQLSSGSLSSLPPALAIATRHKNVVVLSPVTPPSNLQTTLLALLAPPWPPSPPPLREEPARTVSGVPSVFKCMGVQSCPTL